MKTKATPPATELPIKSVTIDRVFILRKPSGRLEYYLPTNMQQIELRNWKRRNAAKISAAFAVKPESEQLAPSVKRTKLTRLTLEPSNSESAIEYGTNWERRIEVYTTTRRGSFGEEITALSFEAGGREISIFEVEEEATEEQLKYLGSVKKSIAKRNADNARNAEAGSEVYGSGKQIGEVSL